MVNQGSIRLIGAQIAGFAGIAIRIDMLATTITVGAAVENLIDIDTLRLLEGIIAVYMPDIKFGDNATAQKYTKSYRPAHKSYEFSELSRGVSKAEYAQAVRQARQLGLSRVMS